MRKMRSPLLSGVLLLSATTGDCLLAKTSQGVRNKLSSRSKTGGVFKQVVDALQKALTDVAAQKKANDDEYTKVSCVCNELIDEAKENIPKHEENIEKAKAKLEELRAENEKLSVKSAELDEAVAKNTAELKDATALRKEEKDKYDTDMADMTEGVSQMTAALKILSEGTALIQTSAVPRSVALKHLSTAVEKMRGSSRNALSQTVSMIQTGTRTSGQIIGILTNLKTTFEADMATMTAKEKEALAYFTAYKERTEAQIKADSELSADHKETIADNSGVIDTTAAFKKTEEGNLKAMEAQLKEQTTILADHTRFHTETSAAASAQEESISGAITLLSSPEAMKTAAKSEEHMEFPDFLQTGNSGRVGSVAVAQREAGSYGWSAVYNAIDDMLSSLNDEIAEAKQHFVDCEAALKMHAVNEHTLKEEKTKRLAQIADLEESIDASKKTIEESNDTIASRSKAIAELTQDIRDTRANSEKETAEASAAHSLFLKAIEFLKSFEPTKVEGPAESAGSSYATGAIEAGNEKVISIVTEVDESMMKNVKELQDKAAEDIESFQEQIATAKDEIADAEAALAKAQTDLAEATKDLNSQNRYMEKINEGLAGESAWWGPAPGNKLPAPGQHCAEYVGRSDLYDGPARVGSGGEYAATSDTDGSGVFHSKIKSATDEVASLKEMKKTVKDLESAYITPQN
ncbi:unnamed protein product [Amoebophrya sp. A120]|nr:unnamed protein product [Amoebophrya sp. A120]|eukprot:GSA120T00005071001.1